LTPAYKSALHHTEGVANYDSSKIVNNEMVTKRCRQQGVVLFSGCQPGIFRLYTLQPVHSIAQAAVQQCDKGTVTYLAEQAAANFSVVVRLLYAWLIFCA